MANKKPDRKNKGQFGAQKRSSSVPMVASKRRKDVLELGIHLVKELAFEQTDTLGCWLCHHIAELLQAVDSASSPNGRKEAEKLATEAILTVWEHRAGLPGRANPIAPYRQILGLLTEMTRNANPWSTVEERDRTGAVARRLHNLFCQVFATILANQQHGPGSNAPNVVHRLLPAEESRIVLDLGDLLSAHLTPKLNPEGSDDVRDPTDILIDETIDQLQMIRTLLKSKGTNPQVDG